MSKDVNIRYSDSDLSEFKKLINQKISKAKHDLELIKSAYWKFKCFGKYKSS